MNEGRPVFSAPLRSEADVVALRQQALLMASHLGFDRNDQTRIATAVSEVARNAVLHGGGGTAQFSIEVADGREVLRIRVRDQGQGIPGLDTDEPVQPPVGPAGGMGLVGAPRLMDRVDVRSRPGRGTVVDLAKALPRRRAAEARPESLLPELTRLRAADPFAVLHEQNRDLISSLAELTERNAELERISTELQDTNRGVVALYAELDTKAEQLREASELKSRFLSNMSHEFRTPLNSILAISRLLLDRLDGDLAPEQEKQVLYIRRSAEALREMVDDLLDLAKVEAGKLDVRIAPMRVPELFGALRGALRPLQVDSVALVIEEPPQDFPDLVTDEGKVAQILRNLISNALKFTERGEVRVRASLEQGVVAFAVSDTGVGIAAGDVVRIFEEFEQVENRLQSRHKGTGLGLPLSRKLAELLGGSIDVDSKPGRGSTFTLRLPLAPGQQEEAGAAPLRLLVIDDHEPFRYVVRQIVAGDPGLRLAEAAEGLEGLALARAERPDAILLDLQMPGVDGMAVIEQMQADPALKDIPVLVFTSRPLTPVLRARLGHARAILAKDELSRETFRAVLASALPALRKSPAGTVV